MTEEKIKPLIQEEVKTSMRMGEREKTTTLRMAVAEIKKEEIEKKSDLNDQEVTSILQKMIKQRKDSCNQFRSAGRDELAQKEEREIETLTQFLPEQLGEEEIKELVTKAITNLKAETPQDIGKVMGTLKSDLQGKADMSVVSHLVKEKLTK
jgi:uncharacterized protein YqeY|tara:strand:- start:84 stop:539 length:456 start_codon:yes stop_codon:yes gene_type:complete